MRGFRRVATWTGAALALDLAPAELPEGGTSAVLLQLPDQGPIIGAATLEE